MSIDFHIVSSTKAQQLHQQLIDEQLIVQQVNALEAEQLMQQQEEIKRLLRAKQLKAQHNNQERMMQLIERFAPHGIAPGGLGFLKDIE